MYIFKRDVMIIQKTYKQGETIPKRLGQNDFKLEMENGKYIKSFSLCT